MKYRVQVDLSFDDEQDAVDIINAVEKIKTKSYLKSGYMELESYMPRVCQYHKCGHDVDPREPCVDYTTIDFDGVEKIHVKKD